MHTHIALLRAVNVAGHNRISMAELCALAADVGLHEPRSLLASGNLVFGSSERNGERLVALLQRETESRLGVTSAFFVRSSAEWDEMVALNPFAAWAKRDPAHLHALVLSAAPSRAASQALTEAIVGREEVRVVGRTGYAVYPDGAGRSKLTPALIERRLGVRCTARNWNTVLKLAAAASARG